VVNVWSVNTSSLEAHATALASAAARGSADIAGGSTARDGSSVAEAAHLAGADAAATGADTARWEALAGGRAFVEELRDLFTLVELREAEAAAEAEQGPLGGAPPGTVPALIGACLRLPNASAMQFFL
jgi:hypothetical protein